MWWPYREIDAAVIDNWMGRELISQSMTGSGDGGVPPPQMGIRRMGAPRRRNGQIVKGRVTHTAHLVLARVLGLGAAEAEHRRRLGTDSVNALEAEVTAVALGWDMLVVNGDDGAGPAGKGVSDGHGGVFAQKSRSRRYRCVEKRRRPGLITGEKRRDSFKRFRRWVLSSACGGKMMEMGVLKMQSERGQLKSKSVRCAPGRTKRGEYQVQANTVG